MASASRRRNSRRRRGRRAAVRARQVIVRERHGTRNARPRRPGPRGARSARPSRTPGASGSTAGAFPAQGPQLACTAPRASSSEPATRRPAGGTGACSTGSTGPRSPFSSRHQGGIRGHEPAERITRCQPPKVVYTARARPPVIGVNRFRVESPGSSESARASRREHHDPREDPMTTAWPVSRTRRRLGELLTRGDVCHLRGKPRRGGAVRRRVRRSARAGAAGRGQARGVPRGVGTIGRGGRAAAPARIRITSHAGLTSAWPQVRDYGPSGAV